MASLREKYLSEGAMLIKGELEDQASYAVELGQKVALRNVDLFSSSLLANRNIHQTIKTASICSRRAKRVNGQPNGCARRPLTGCGTQRART